MPETRFSAEQTDALRDQLRAFDYPGRDRLKKNLKGDDAHTHTVIEEYRKFVFLASIRPEGACPSPLVDEAWHAHILHTREYQRFCAKVLGYTLHHLPGDGSPHEKQRIADLYQKTLESYRQCFGCEPPLEVWPHQPGDCLECRCSED